MNWTCPYCDRDQTLTKNWSVQTEVLKQEGSPFGKVALIFTNIVCANNACKKLTLTASLAEFQGWDQYNRAVSGKKLFQWALIPESSAKPQPTYIPAPLRDDYEEACKISMLSPKSSATLARRCLQGMIRDFCGISKDRLIDEIRELRTRVDAGKGPQGVMHDSIDAIDHVRGIGNIGAHMEKDINIIVDIDPNESSVLIGLVELLFKEWYVARHQRQQRFADLKKVAGDKKAAKVGPPTQEQDKA